MKKKINIQFMALTVIIILVSAILSTCVSYTMLKEQVMNDLESYAYALEGSKAFEEENAISYENRAERIRVTLVGKDGEVIYDTKADVSKMENHKERKEVIDAFRYGKGSDIRKSETLRRDTFYYALLLENGCVLRVAEESGNMVSILFSYLPIMIVVAIVLCIVSVVFARFLTKSIISPIEEMAKDIDLQNISGVYKELRPFVEMIQKQHKDIINTSRMRQEFTANVSHELKTPLTAISGYAELMENGMVTGEEVVHFAGEIHNNANRLLTLINDIIRLSELDSSAIEVECELLDLYEIASKGVEMLRVNAKNHQVTIAIEGEKCEVMANREKMTELVYNLCDNAIRYNNQNGEVFVRTGIDEAGQKYLEVKDTGIGIPMEHQERIFERFYRVDKSRSKLSGGTGLGLAIVKHIVVQSNAELELESSEDKGTRIRVTFSK